MNQWRFGDINQLRSPDRNSHRTADSFWLVGLLVRPDPIGSPRRDQAVPAPLTLLGLILKRRWQNA